MKKYIAEFIGTFTLVLFGTGIAVLSNGNLVATSLAFGLAIVSMAYAIGNISGCHVNPCVSLAMLINKKISLKDFTYYVISQLLGAIFATLVLKLILDSTIVGSINLGANGFDTLSATNISLLGAAICEIILTFIFIYTILAVTSDDSKSNIAGIVIGLTLTFVHLLGIRLTGTSVNPARSIAPALFTKGEAFAQLWVFILFPLIGAVLAAYVFKYLNCENKFKNILKKIKK